MEKKLHFKLILSWLVVSVIILSQLSPICNAQQLPIKPARTISFETTEATYMDVDLSTDGKKIVFDILGDLYTIPATGGIATQLTRGLAFNRYPAWSPDGKLIAFLSDASGSGHVNIINTDGANWRTLGASDPQIDFQFEGRGVSAWTPDGNYIAAAGRIYHMAGGRMVLPTPPYAEVQFSGDGQFMYYFEHGSINRYDRHSGAVVKLANISGYPVNPKISPDSKWAVYITQPDPKSDLHLYNLATGEDRLLAIAIEDHYRRFSERYCFTPDSKSLLIGFGGKIHRISLQSGVDTIIPFKAKVNVDLGSFDYNTFRVNHDSLQVRYTRSAGVSPDGKRLAFVALGRIYVMDIPGGNPQLLVQQDAGQFEPLYSPDGKWIAYVIWSDRSGGAVWRVPATGGKPQKLTNESGCYAHLAWSPDGERLAVVKGVGSYLNRAGGLGELSIIDIVNNISRTIADSIPMNNYLSFAASGNKVLYMPNTEVYRDKPYAQWASITADGASQQVVAITPVNQGSQELHIGDPEQITISPDDRYLVYRFNEDLYLVPNPTIGNSMMLDDINGTKPVIRFALGGNDPKWAEGGNELTWSYGNEFYSVNPDKVISAAIKAARDTSKVNEEELNDKGYITCSVVPDQTITINLKVPKQFAHGTIALKNVRILTMKGSEVIENGTIVISDGKFEAVGPSDQIHIPSSVKIIDLKGKTVIPGLIDLHDHMDKPDNMVPQQSWKFLVNLAYGVTSAREPSHSLGAFGEAELLETGQMIGPRLFSVGRAVTPDWTIHNLDDAREIVKKRGLYGATLIKQYLQETRTQRQWLLMASREAGLNMTNEGISIAEHIEMMKDGSTGVEHTPHTDWGKVYNDVTTFLSHAQTWLTPTLQVTADDAIPYFDNYYRQHPDRKLSRFWPDEQLKKLKVDLAPKDSAHLEFVDISKSNAIFRHAGMKVTVGAHGNEPGIGTHFEIWALQMGGLTNMEALQAATIMGAEGLGMQQDLGSIEVGKIADLVVLDKNPLDDIHNTRFIRYVLKDGILYNGDNLDELWPQKKKCPDWRLEDVVPDHK
jgi:Tol biopolymer transport system component